MKNPFKKLKQAFTLVELIIVIAIVAILSVAAFLVVTKWIGKSRDSRRLADLGAIKRAVDYWQADYEDNAMGYVPEPSGKTGVLDTLDGVVWIQGTFGSESIGQIDTMQKTPLDPTSEEEYYYSITTNKKEFQVIGFLENGDEVSYLDKTYANESYGELIAEGTYEGYVVSSGSLVSALDVIFVKPDQLDGFRFDVLVAEGAPLFQLGAPTDNNVILSTRTVDANDLGSATQEQKSYFGGNDTIINIVNTELKQANSNVIVDGGTDLGSDVEGGSTPTTTGDPYWDNVVFLADFNDGLIDYKGNTVTKYGTESLLSGGVYDSNNSSNFVKVDSNDGMFVGTNDFTIELMIRSESNSAWQVPIASWDNNDASDWVLHKGDGNLTFHARGTGSSVALVTASIDLNKWYHVAVVRKDGITSMYVDGVLIGTNSAVYNMTSSSQPFTIGHQEIETSRAFVGQLDNIRFTNGVARYEGSSTTSANFDLPGEHPTSKNEDIDPYWDNVVLYSKFDGNLNDSKGVSTLTSDGVTYPDVDSTYGKSVKITDGHRIDVSPESNMDFQPGEDYTVEARIKSESNVSGYQILMERGSTNTSGNDSWYLALVDNIPVFQVRRSDGTTRDRIDGVNSVDIGSWNHIAVSKIGNSYHLYLNGVLEGSVDSDGTSIDIATNRVFFIGTNPNTDYWTDNKFQGEIDEVRLTKGIARYQTNFDPSSWTKPFATTSN